MQASCVCSYAKAESEGLAKKASCPGLFLDKFVRGGGKMKRIKSHIIRLYEIKEMRGKRECGRQRKWERQGAG